MFGELKRALMAVATGPLALNGLHVLGPSTHGSRHRTFGPEWFTRARAKGPARAKRAE